jgi:outer membrane cobalamin receptor
LKTISLCLALLLASLWLSAAAEVDSLRVYTLQPIRVIADTPEKALSQVRSITITKARQALDIQSLLDDTAGLSSALGTKDESSLRIRGFYRSDIQVLVNGRPLSKG